MRVSSIILSIVCAFITAALIFTLDIQLPTGGSKTPRLGYFLSPQKGFWQNAESVNDDFSADLKFDDLSGNSQVYFDDRLVPHVYAANEHDAFFIQGYLHAKFRLWQMDFETYAAAGRLSEIMGDSSSGTNFLSIDKFFRRLGMVYGAENSLKAMEADPVTKATLDAYTEGVNAYINSLGEKDYPFEYKLLNYKPEQWSNLKSALLQMYLSFDLAGFEQDFEKTNAKSIFTKEQYDALYPYAQDSLKLIIPKGTAFAKPGIDITPPAIADSAYFNFKKVVPPAVPQIKPYKNDGSNNWAVAGSKTKSGRPILCNDPHLSLNLPSLWYEMQISYPGINVYGVTLPGSPLVIIGFNDNIAWGLTNAGRDVRDYYQMKFKDETMQQYWYNGTWRRTAFRDEIIRIKGKADDTEHIAMTVWGPVMFDKDYPDKLNTNEAYAVHWKAIEPNNSLSTFYGLAHAKNYSDYLTAISSYTCPGQNFAFASKSGDVAIKQQGQFPAKWRGQGDFIMPGDDTTYAWRGDIPDSENIVLHNPERGFVSSANQRAYDTSYPYYLGQHYPLFRAYEINKQLSAMQNITVNDMETLQKNNLNVLAQMAKPALLKYLYDSTLTTDEKNYLNIFKNWDLNNDANSKGASVFSVWWDSLVTTLYGDEFSQSKLPLALPEDWAMLEDIRNDSSKLFADDINTPQKEDIAMDVTNAFKKAVPFLRQLDQKNRLAWGIYKGSAIRHLLRIPALSRMNVISGGGDDIINAFTKYHGPSWRMVVELTDKINAYAIYPGGQDGNPGSKYYDQFINDYLAGKYYKLLFAPESELQQQNNLKGKITFSKS